MAELMTKFTAVNLSKLIPHAVMENMAVHMCLNQSYHHFQRIFSFVSFNLCSQAGKNLQLSAI